MTPEQILQERLERLEKGEMLENTLMDLPDEEGELLYLAAQILAIPKPERNSTVVKEQYRNVIRAAKQHVSKASSTPSSRFSLKWLIPVALVLLLFVGVAGVSIGIALFPGQKNSTPESIALSTNDAVHPIGTPPVWSRTPVSEFIATPSHVVNPQTASLVSGRGIVQVQTKNGDWDIVQAVELQAGQTIRTSMLSSAQLGFFDGSVVAIGPNTQIKIETLNAADQGPRQIELLQMYGETTHIVSPPVEQASSSYIVHTPNASGEAKGTTFQVSVTRNKNSSFAVIDGEIAVIGQETMVSVSPGQITYVLEDMPPQKPVFGINLQGEVSLLGDTWIIGDTEFKTDEQTVVVGFPRIKDIVFVRGRLMPDNTYIADRIELYSPALINRFKIFGVVEEIGVSVWRVSGQEISVNEDTHIGNEITIGAPVLIQGVVQKGGALLGTQIQLVEENKYFELTGLLEQIDAQNWIISEALVITNEETKITGDPTVGKLVHVEGQILSDGTWLAREIETVIETTHFEFFGTVETISPWIVDGISFEVNDQTQISPNIDMGASVQVAGVILENGTWLANEIQLFQEEDELLIFVGIVEDMNPWVLNGIPLNTTEDTMIVGDAITVASLVRVYINITENGSWQVLRIELIDAGPAAGCIEFSDTIVSFDTNEIVLANRITIPRAFAEIAGELITGKEAFVRLCFGPDGQIIFASITIMPDEIDPTSIPGSDPSPIPEDKVTICHVSPGNSGNAKTMTVDLSAVDAHLKHGDYLGPCEDNGGNDDKNDKNDKGNGNNK